MADLVLPAVLQVLFEKLASPLLRKLGNLWNLTDNFEKLQRSLVYVQSILEDAEEKQISNRDVKTWLSELKRVIYDAEDLLDDITNMAIYDALEKKPEKKPATKFKYLYSYRDGIAEVLRKLEMTGAEGSKFDLREGSMIHTRIKTSSFVIDSEVFGREDDKEKVVELLLSSGATQRGRVLCIPIVGLGGIGKTTLAQLAYNDHRVKHHFDVQLWVFVSDHFDATAILMAVIESLTGECRYSSMDALHTAVQDLLRGKRYLIVLDEVWTANQGDWEELRPLFSSVVDGSKIIITTRSERVAMKFPTYSADPYHLDGLSEEACVGFCAIQTSTNNKHIYLGSHMNLGPKVWRPKYCKSFRI